ncbi:MAG: putative metal-dependent hydrolase [Bacteroidia bacterium]|nr:putative metal-dependent hydrolase [Bacteroidia bacterium]NNF31888.1 putative metal-dependent hydrolase [Flavobacteriaceae bacterium]MBT8277003.1 putative metal-dependent hydrolase [Bacteroidia bacterium]NNJ82205.1 putative metal-dependent hydrolase [Flavobacteriaceae bacterium]NNK53576.1 putative metal-dependent hydrolase [Flavobacteriaceae bacterium]
MEKDHLKFPVGKFEIPKTISDADLNEAITILEVFPEQLKMLTYNLKDEELDSPYREGSWTIRQLVHHISDSHHHSYNRIRWALSEDNPMIKAYDQDAFAELEDYKTWPIAWSFIHIEAIHHKIVNLLRMLTEEQWQRTFRHPEMEKEMNLRELALMYAWHSMHHYAHIKNALDKA